MTRNKVKEAIREAGLTYTEIGTRIGITRSAVSEVVAGRSKGAGTRFAIAQIIGKEVEELWPEGEDEEVGVAADGTYG